jgi:GNAT superfamily N-acetyltransferase
MGGFMSEPPRLNHYFDQIPDACECLHLHDIVVADEFRGRGHTSDFIRIFLEAAKNKDKPKATLVAVGGTESLWRHFGFQDPGLQSAKDALLSYSETSTYMARDI